VNKQIETCKDSDECKALSLYQRQRRIVKVSPSPQVTAVIARSAAWRAKADLRSHD
jgi:uncharacterized lipoprotein YajG